MMSLFGPEEGHYALALACVIAFFQGLFPFLERRARTTLLTRLTPALAWAHVSALLLAFFSLTLAALRDDFSVQNIAENSSLSKPLLYKITGIWSNHEGSILLWIVILGLCSALVARSVTHRRLSVLHRDALGTLGFIEAGFDLFCLLTSNPFTRLFPMPSDGLGMNPLLQDPGLAFHPPLLYAGYVGFAVPFAFAISGLYHSQLDHVWGRLVRPWTVLAWALLTCGITLGSWWSYYVLGWGGYWFWDPVENASLIPWLSGTALLHSIIVVEKRNGLRLWAALLAIATFSFSLSGTFLVRSGILNSVHSFASDPTRGVFILALLSVVIGGALALFAWRAPSLNNGPTFAPFSRESALVFNNIFLCTLCAVVLTGTLYPPFIQLLLGHTLSVGKPFFDSTTIPLTLPLFLLMGVGTSLQWRHASLTSVASHLRPALLCALIASVPAFLYLHDILAALCATLAIWVIASTLTDALAHARRSSRLRHISRFVWGQMLAHMGVGITLLGLCGMSAAQHIIVASHLGEHHELAGNDWYLTSISQQAGPNYQALEATIDVRRHGSLITQLHPALHTFPQPSARIAHIAIHASLYGDFYAVLGSAEEDGKVTRYILRLHYNPLASWIWIGGLMMALGGMLTVPRRSHRRQGKPQCH